MLIVAPNERKVRIEVGRGLEGTLTDALSKIIIENGILPRFREGDFAGGIKDGVRDIILVLTGDAAEVEQRGKARRDADNPIIDWLVMILWLAIWLWIVYSIWRSVLYASRAGRAPEARSSSPERPGAAAAAAGAVEEAAMAAAASRAAAEASVAAAPPVVGRTVRHAAPHP